MHKQIEKFQRENALYTASPIINPKSDKITSN